MVDDPFVLRRVLWLRQFPWLGEAELPEVAMLAENLTEVRFAAGAVVAPAHARPPAVHFVVEGELANATRTWGPRTIVGALEVLAKRPLVQEVVAVRESRTLQLAETDVAEILEENFGVLRAALRGLAHGMPRTLARVIAPPPLADPLGFVDRLMLLRTQPAYGGARLDALAALAHASAEVRFAPGTQIVRLGEPAVASFVIIEGWLAGPDGDLGPGHAIAALETLADLPHPATLESRTAVRALESSAGAIFDVLEDHSDLGIAMLAGFAGALADLRT
jgi:CRP-like cAMP-binding protein